LLRSWVVTLQKRWRIWSRLHGWQEIIAGGFLHGGVLLHRFLRSEESAVQMKGITGMIDQCQENEV
jgi:hypothetical protein